MAKTPSLKQQLIQELANQQVAQYRQSQQQNNDIAQLQAQYDAWQKQQEVSALEAQYNDWLKAQQPAQPEAPAVETPTVEAPIVETAQKPIQKIPSLPKRSLRLEQEEAKMLQKEAQQKQALKEMDNSLRRNRLNDLAQIGLGEAPEKTPWKKPGEIKEVVSLNDTYGNSDVSVPDEIIAQYAEKKGVSFDDAKAEILKAESMRNQSITTPGNIDEAATQDIKAQYDEKRRRELQHQLTPYEAAITSGSKAITDVVNGPVYLAGKVTGNDWDLYPSVAREEARNAAEQHPTASGLGTMAGMATGAFYLGGGLGGRALSQAGGVSAADAFNAASGESLLNGASKTEAIINGLKEGAYQTGKNALKDMPIDMATDIIPTLANDIAEGKSTGDIVKNTIFNTGINGGMNSFGDILALGKAMKNTNFDVGKLPRVELPESGATKQILPGMETAEDVTKSINDQFSELMKKNRPETSSMKDIYSVDDLDNAMNRQLSQAISENTSHVKHEMPEAPKADIPKMEAPKMPEAEIPKMEAPKAEAPKTELPKQPEMVDGVRQYIKNENLTPEANTKINSYLQQLDDVFDSPEVADAVDDIFKNVQSEEGSKLMIDYMDLSGELRKTTDPAQAQAIREQLKELYGNLKSVNPEEKAFIKDMMDMTEVQNAINDYKIALAGSDKDAVKKAAQAIDNARNRIPRRKGADPRLSKAFGGSFGPVIKRPLNEFNFKETEDILDLIDDGVNPNKVMAEDIDSAKKAAYNLQTFADAPKEKWETSKYYTNSANKRGYADKLDKSDYAYRKTNAQEQIDIFNERYKDSKDVVRDLVEADAFTAADMRGAMDTMDKLMNGSIDDVRRGSRLGKKISFEGREGGRVVQAMSEAKANTPSGQLREAQRTIGDAIDKRVGEGTTEALDNIYEKVMQSFEDSTTKEEFADKLKDVLSGDLKQHVSSKTAKKMQSKQIKGLKKITAMLDKAESLDNVKIDDLMDVIYKQNGGVLLSPQTEKEVYDLLVEASKLDPSSYEFRKLQAQAARKVMAEVPSGLGDYIRAFLYDNMLGNFKTAFSRNLMGNVAYQTLEKVRELPSAIVDKAVSLKTGKHSTLGWNTEKAGAYKRGFKTGGFETLRDIKNGVNTTRSGQTGWGETLKNNRTIHNDNTAIGHWANQVDFYVENAMKGGDRPIYEANYAEFKTELEQMLERYGKDGVVGLENVKDEDIPEVIDGLAAMRASDAVFQKKGHMSEGLSKMRDGLGELSRGTLGVDILSTASSPFTLTPGNMLEKAIEYTPLGAIKNAVETAKELANGNFNQRRFVEEAGRTITGIPVLAAAYAGAKNGIINGGLSTDPDEKQAQLDDGFIEYGLNVPEGAPLIGGKTLDTSDLPVYGPFVQAGAVMAEEGITPKSMLQAGEAVLGGSATQGIRRTFGAENGSYSSQEGVLDNLKNTVLSSGTQLVPSLVRQTAQTTDKYKRDLGEYGTTEYYINSIKNSLPGLRQTLPIKTDVEGQPILQNQGRNIVSKALENYVLPMNMSEYKPSPLNDEASRLLKETGEAYAFQPKALRKDLRQWDDKAGKEFSEKQFRDYKENLGRLNTEMGKALMDSKYYDSLSDEEKLKAMQSAYSAMKGVAKYNATGIESDDKLVNAFLSKKNPTMAAKAVIEEMETKHKLDKYGLADNNITRRLAEEKPDKWLKYYSDAKKRLNGSTSSENIQNAFSSMPTLSNKEKAEMYSYIDTDASPGANPYGYVPGINYKPEKDKLYQKAKAEIPSLKPEQYYETKDTIDVGGGGISQEELLNYINAEGMNENKAQQYWAAYGGWSNKKGETKKLVGTPGHYTSSY